MKTQAKTETKSELGSALGSCRNALLGIGAFSWLINLLMLTGSLFMLEVYDRVLPSRSVPTLVGLSILAAILFTFQSLLEITRGRLLVRIGSHLDGRLSPRIYDALVRVRSKPGSDGQQPVRDLDTIRSFLSGAGPTAFFDLPWIPLYLAICFAFHPMIGVTALGGAIVLMSLTCSPNCCRVARSRPPLRMRRREIDWRKRAGATPRCSWQWGCRSGSWTAGSISRATIARSRSAPPT